MLESLPGWRWLRGLVETWETRYDELASYLERNASYPPHQTVLGNWVAYQRASDQAAILADDRRRRLERLPGWRWSRGSHVAAAETAVHLAAVQRYAAKHGAPPPISYVDGESGLAIGKWCRDRRHAYTSGTLAVDLARALESIEGWVWRLNFSWDERKAQLHTFHRSHGRLPMRSDRDEQAAALYHWIATQRRRANRLTDDERRALVQLGVVLDYTDQWQARIDELRAFRSAHRRVPRWSDRDARRLYSWIAGQRRRADQLTASQRDELAQLGVSLAIRQRL